MNAQELAVHRKNTEWFILADPVRVSLKRREKIEKASGGHVWADPPTDIEEQTFRLIPSSDATPMVFTVDGVKLTVSLVLFGKHDADVQRYDKFTVNGVDYQVIGPIRPEHTVDSRYFTKADVARL